MLQRMNELAVQAANGTNSQSDRESIQDEVKQLTTEIDRVAETTKFNEMYLLKGNPDKSTKMVTLVGHDAGLEALHDTSATNEIADMASTTKSSFTYSIDVSKLTGSVTIGGKNYTIVKKKDMPDANDANSDGIDDTDQSRITQGRAIHEIIKSLSQANDIGNTTAAAKLDVDEKTGKVNNLTGADMTTAGAKSGKVNIKIEGDFPEANKDVSGDTVKIQVRKAQSKTQQALAFNLHVGADTDMNNKIGVNIESMDSKYLGIYNLDVVGKDKNGKNMDDGGNAATYAIDAIADAVAKVSKQRSALGAVQNRLEHTIKNVDNVVENTTAAESRIRDTDMADEMVKYSKNNILAQAGQSMLAQANQSTQGVLSLLGG